MAYLDDLPDKMPPVAIAAIPRPRRCLARWRTWKPSCSLVHEIDEPKKSWGLEKPGIIFYIYMEVSIVMGVPQARWILLIYHGRSQRKMNALGLHDLGTSIWNKPIEWGRTPGVSNTNLGHF